VHSALEKLSPEVRSKVLAAVGALLDIPAVPEASGETDVKPKSKIQPTTDGPTTASRPMSIVELIQDKKPSTNPQYIALFAYFREKYENQPRFSRSDLEAYFPKARIAPPSNYDRDFIVTVTRGWIHEDGSDSYLTSRGVEAVEGGFPSERHATEAKKRTKTKTEGRRVKR
jgi:hypothetical protein